MAFVYRYGDIGPGGVYSEPGDVGLDADGNVVLPGTFLGTFSYDIPPGQVPLTSTAEFAAFVVRVDPAGTAIRSDAYPTSLPEFNAERYALASDGQDYVLGLFEETITFDAGPPAIALTSAGHADVFLLRMDTNGDPVEALRWGTEFVSSGAPADRAAGLAVDGTDVYVGIDFAPVLASFATIDADPGPGVENYVAQSFDGLIVKLDGDGDFIRAMHFGGSGSQGIRDIEVDGDQNLVVAGSYSTGIDLDTGPGTAPLTGAGAFLAKYDSDGTLIWGGAFTGGVSQSLSSIDIDADGNILAVGSFSGTMDADPGPGMTSVTASGAFDQFVVKVDPDGDLVWFRQLGDTGSGVDLRDIEVDSEGNPIITGSLSGTIDFDPAGTPSPVTSAGGSDAVVGKYDPDGMLLWVRRFGGSGSEAARDAAVGPNDAINVVGLFGAPTFDWDPGPGTVVLTSLGTSDSFLLRLTAGGTLVTDLTPPTITSIDSSTPDGLYGIGDVINVTVNFDEEVTLDGADLTITLDTGDVVTIAPFTGTSASGSYTVGLGDVSADLNDVDFDLGAGGTIADSSGNVLDPVAIPAGEHLGDNRNLVIDGIPPAVSTPDLAPTSDSGASDSDDLTNDTSPELTGTAEIGATVTLIEGTTTLGTDVADGGGNWSITPAGPLAVGDHTVFAVATDAAGNDSTSGTLTFEIDTVTAVSDPDLTTASDSGSSSTDNITNDTTPAFTGTGEVGATVHLVEGATTLGTDVVDGSGNWAITWSGAPEGAHLVFARAIDLAGNTDDSNVVTLRVDTTAPDTLIDSGPPSPTADTTAEFDFGSDESPVTFAANLNGGPFGPVGELHTVTTPVDGTYTVMVRATDLAGNTDPTPAVHVWEVDALPPVPPVITTFSTDTGTVGDRITSDQTLVVAGTAEPDTFIRLFLPGLGEVGTGMADGTGAWSIGPIASLPEGVYPFTATATDGFDRESDPSAPFQVIIDLAGNPTNQPDILSGNDQANQIQGLDGNDTIFGVGGNDTLKGNNGSDWLDGGNDNDKLEGENGNDTLFGQNGNDSLYGQNGNDLAEGGNGNDRLEGGSGNDSLLGGNGADSMLGGAGTDRLEGGTGADRYLGEADGDLILLAMDGVRDSVMGSIAHLGGDTLDGFVGGAPTSPGADVLIIQGLTIAQAKKLDGQDVGDGSLDLSMIGGGAIVFENLTVGDTVDTVLGGGGEIYLYIV